MQSMFADLLELIREPLKEKGVKTDNSIMLVYPPDRELDFREYLLDSFVPLLESKQISFRLLDLAGFVTEYHNMMEFTFGQYDSLGTPWDIATMGNPTFNDLGAQSKNVEDARISGLELSVIGTGKIREIGIDILAGYTFLN